MRSRAWQSHHPSYLQARAEVGCANSEKPRMAVPPPYLQARAEVGCASSSPPTRADCGVAACAHWHTPSVARPLRPGDSEYVFNCVPVARVTLSNECSRSPTLEAYSRKPAATLAYISWDIRAWRVPPGESRGRVCEQFSTHASGLRSCSVRALAYAKCSPTVTAGRF